MYLIFNVYLIRICVENVYVLLKYVLKMIRVKNDMIRVKNDSLLRKVMIVDNFLVIFLNLAVSIIWIFNTFAEIFSKLMFREKASVKYL